MPPKRKFSGSKKSEDKRQKTSPVYQVGDRIEAKYRGRGRRYYPGVIVGVNHDEGKYEIDYDDGDKDIGLNGKFIRREAVDDDDEEEEEQQQPAPHIGVGWTMKSVRRGAGSAVDKYYINPDGKKFRNMKEVQRYLDANDEKGGAAQNPVRMGGKRSRSGVGVEEEEEKEGGGKAKKRGGDSDDDEDSENEARADPPAFIRMDSEVPIDHDDDEEKEEDQLREKSGGGAEERVAVESWRPPQNNPPMGHLGHKLLAKGSLLGGEYSDDEWVEGIVTNVIPKISLTITFGKGDSGIKITYTSLEKLYEWEDEVKKLRGDVSDDNTNGGLRRSRRRSYAIPDIPVSTTSTTPLSNGTPTAILSVSSGTESSGRGSGRSTPLSNNSSTEEGAGRRSSTTNTTGAGSTGANSDPTNTMGAGSTGANGDGTNIPTGTGGNNAGSNDGANSGATITPAVVVNIEDEIRELGEEALKEQEETIQKFHDDKTEQYETEGKKCLDDAVIAATTSLKKKVNEKKAIHLKELDEQKQQNEKLMTQTTDGELIANYRANIKAIKKRKRKLSAEYEQYYKMECEQLVNKITGKVKMQLKWEPDLTSVAIGAVAIGGMCVVGYGIGLFLGWSVLPIVLVAGSLVD